MNEPSEQAKQAAEFLHRPNISEPTLAEGIQSAIDSATAELRAERDAGNKALARVKELILSSDDFSADEVVEIINARVGRYSQSVEWFAPKAIVEERDELRAENARLTAACAAKDAALQKLITRYDTTDHRCRLADMRYPFEEARDALNQTKPTP